MNGLMSTDATTKHQGNRNKQHNVKVLEMLKFKS